MLNKLNPFSVRRSDHRRGLPGFTITEMLVVIGIIVLLAALAVPAINVLSGSRSIDGASNIVSGMLGTARATALARQETIGLAIFRDPLRDRVGLALVSGPQPWRDGVTYQRGDFVSYPVSFVAASGTRRVTWYFLCNTPNTGRVTAAANEIEQAPNYNNGLDSASDAWTPIETAATTSDPDAPYTAGVPASYGRRYSTSEYVSLLPETDVTYLPPGVGAEVLNSSRREGPLGAAQSDRYLSSSVIFFSGDGRMAVGRRFGVMFDSRDLALAGPANPIHSSRLGLTIRFNNESPVTSRSTNMDPVDQNGATGPTPGSYLTGGLGVILFDQAGYASQNAPRWDPQLVSRPYNDVSYNDVAGENWLDANGTLLMINRFNGTVFKSE